MARWASLSLARLRASCEGVRVETLRVPLRLEDDGLVGSAEDDRGMANVLRAGGRRMLGTSGEQQHGVCVACVRVCVSASASASAVISVSEGVR